MLSVVVVGRNDNHGYNLGKRVANSLNSIAMRLTEGDELIFVDWNTPRPFPPMPIAIIDDLTKDTKKYLHIISVDESTHNANKGSSDKKILEPIARNVGIQRANKSNKWILSTNTDILFVGEQEIKFQEIINHLDERMWQSFRFEVPEYLWERFDKRDPQGTNSFIKQLRDKTPIRLKLSTNPDSRPDSSLIFADAIGDFQLAPRSHWFQISGFPEDMLDGWHVDSRAAFQMISQTGLDSKILDRQLGLETYHQNHLRSLTHFHQGSIMNDERLISEPYKNQSTWGIAEINLPKLGIETFDLSNISLKFKEIKNEPIKNLQQMHLDLSYDVDRAIFFLIDELIALKANDLVVIISANKSFIDKITESIKSKTVRVLIVEDLSDLSLLKKSKLIIIDFGIDSLAEDFDSVKILAGNIALSIEKIAHEILPGTRISLIRSTNWAIRTYSKLFFSVPLFNNYSLVSTGTKKNRVEKYSIVQTQFLLQGIKFDYASKSNSTKLNNWFFNFAKKVLPLKTKNILKRLLLK